MISVEELVRFLGSPMHPLNIVSAGIALLVAGFLLMGSRLAWIVATLGAAAGLVASLMGQEPSWIIASSAVVGICLLTPSTVQFVWRNKSQRRSKGWGAPLQRISNQFTEAYIRVVTQTSSSPSIGKRRVFQRSEVELQSLLAGAAIVAAGIFVLMGAVGKWHNGSGSDSEFVAALLKVVEILFEVAKLILIALIALVVYKKFAHRKSSEDS